MVNLSFTSTSDWREVYEPSDDTFLIEDVFQVDKQSIFNLNPNIICELGSGSGYLTTSLLTLLKVELNIEPISYMIDINYKALEFSKKMIINNNLKNSIELLQMNLFTSFKINKSSYLFDLIIFNPPYVPSTNQELIDSINNPNINSSWSGGINGLFYISYFIFGDNRLVINYQRTKLKFGYLPCLHDILDSNGLCYLLVEKNNKLKLILEYISKDKRYENWEIEVILDRKVRFEHLYVLRFLRK